MALKSLSVKFDENDRPVLRPSTFKTVYFKIGYRTLVQVRVNQDKLWHRIDLDGFNAVKSDVVMKRIAGPHRPFSTQESFF